MQDTAELKNKPGPNVPRDRPPAQGRGGREEHACEHSSSDQAPAGLTPSFSNPTVRAASLAQASKKTGPLPVDRLW